ncbi:hypothetical protein AMECASPLE_039386 [Ameca splendens]|uniref:Uncharacterized protein n=1 Tax=Ameca splendens TaxID=208324 RepID=A0ABV1A6F8_9TELE
MSQEDNVQPQADKHQYLTPDYVDQKPLCPEQATQPVEYKHCTTKVDYAILKSQVGKVHRMLEYHYRPSGKANEFSHDVNESFSMCELMHVLVDQVGLSHLRTMCDSPVP